MSRQLKSLAEDIVIVFIASFITELVYALLEERQDEKEYEGRSELAVEHIPSAREDAEDQLPDYYQDS